MMNMLGKAIEIAMIAHNGQLDKGGKPYILHPLWVMNQVRHLGEKYQIVAVLHDSVEDTDENSTLNVTIKYLLDQGFDTDIVHAISLLTHNKDEKSYDEYIRDIGSDEIARIVKLKDLDHNSRITRLKGLRKKDFDRLMKYHRAFTYLSE